MRFVGKSSKEILVATKPELKGGGGGEGGQHQSLPPLRCFPRFTHKFTVVTRSRYAVTNVAQSNAKRDAVGIVRCVLFHDENALVEMILPRVCSFFEDGT